MRASAWLPLLALFGCDGVGRAIIGSTAEDGDPAGIMCRERDDQSCRWPFEARTLPVPPVTDPTANCRSSGPCDPVFGPLRECTLEMRPGTSDPTRRLQGVCSRVDVVATPGISTIRLPDVGIEFGQLTLRAGVPTTFTLQRIDLHRVNITLRGPVTLEILEGTLSDVMLLGDGPSEVRMRRVDGRGVSALLPRGMIDISRSTLRGGALHASDVELNATAVSAMEIKADRIRANELQGTDLELDASQLSLAALDFDDLKVMRCDEALITASSLSLGVLAPCTDVLHVHNTILSGVRAYGRIESRTSQWEGVALGAGGTPTELELWQGSLAVSALCSGVSRLAVSASRSLICNDCAALPDPVAQICASQPDEEAVSLDPTEGLLFTNDDCPQMDEPLTACDPAVSFDSPF